MAQISEAQKAKKRWDETAHGSYPAPGWTLRLSDIGQKLGIATQAVGKLLDIMALRDNRQPTDKAVAAGYGVRRWDGDRFHIDWHRDLVVRAIKSAAAMPGDSAVSTLLQAAALKEQASLRLAAEREQRRDIEDGNFREQQAVMTAQRQEVAAMLITDPCLPLLDAVEFVVPDPSERLALYRSLADCKGAQATEPALLERRAAAEGFST